MQTTPLSLVTLIAEPVLEARLTSRLLALGATGFTVTECHGEGSLGRRAGDIPGAGVRIEVVTARDVADRIVEEVSREYFQSYSVVVWLSEVAVVRGEKFVRHR